MDNELAPYKRHSTLLLLLIVGVALSLRVWSLDFGLPHRYHVDEPPQVIAALRIAQGDMAISYPGRSPNLQQFFLTGLLGGLFAYQVATGAVESPAAFAYSYKISPTSFYLLARGLSVASSVLAIVLLFLLARRLRGTPTALAASLFLGFCFLDVRHAHFAESYSLIALLVLVCVLASVHHASTGKRWWLIAASVTCGAALGLRYSSLPLVVVPFLAAVRGARSNQASDTTRGLLQSVGLIAVAVPLGVLIGTPSLVVNSQQVFSTAGLLHARLAFSSEGFFGFRFTDWPTWRFYGTVLGIAWGWPLLLAAAIGVGRALWRRQVEDALVLAYPAGYGAVLLLASGSSSAFARYLVPVLPFLALFAAEGLNTVLGCLVGHRSARTRQIGLAIGAIALIFLPAMRIARLNHLWSMTDTRTLAKNWIETYIPDGSRIATQWHGPPLSTEADPEPNSQRTYDVTVLDPFLADPDLYSMDYYQSHGFDYLILSSFIYELRRADPAENEIRDSFYSTLDEDAVLVATFEPYAVHSAPPFLFEQIWGPITDLASFERPGPVIKIYRFVSSTVSE